MGYTTRADALAKPGGPERARAARRELVTALLERDLRAAFAGEDAPDDAQCALLISVIRTEVRSMHEESRPKAASPLHANRTGLRHDALPPCRGCGTTNPLAHEPYCELVVAMEWRREQDALWLEAHPDEPEYWRWIDPAEALLRQQMTGLADCDVVAVDRAGRRRYGRHLRRGWAA